MKGLTCWHFSIKFPHISIKNLLLKYKTSSLLKDRIHVYSYFNRFSCQQYVRNLGTPFPHACSSQCSRCRSAKLFGQREYVFQLCAVIPILNTAALYIILQRTNMKQRLLSYKHKNWRIKLEMLTLCHELFCCSSWTS